MTKRIKLYPFDKSAYVRADVDVLKCLNASNEIFGAFIWHDTPEGPNFGVLFMSD